MELAIYRKRNNYRIIAIIMAAICALCLIPASIVLASVLNDATIGMTGVNNSDLTAGMTGVGNGDLLIDNDGTGIHINPSQYPLLPIIPLVFLAVALLLLINLAFSEDKSIKKLIYAAILIIIALSMLASIQFSVTNLLGG